MLNYTDAGHGKVVVLIHGFCESLTLWRSFEQELSLFARVICIDLPGFGESRYFGEEISIEWFADKVSRLMNDLDINSYSVIGHSLGGYVALALADKYTDKIDTITLFHSTALADTEEKRLNRDKAAGFIKRNGLGKFMDSFVAPLFAEENRVKCRDKIENLIFEGKKSDQDAVLQTINAMKNRKSRTDILKNFNKPILMIIGEKDVAVPLTDSLSQSELGDKTESLVLKNCGHMGMIEKPMTTLLRLKEFLLWSFR